MDGVLKSWAVPKGPSLRAEEKRLAVHVEDHPVEYADFEGTIPDGNYGAGAVIVWDRGWYRLVKDGAPRDQLRSGRLEVELFGVKLRGRWTLARMGGKDKEWLMLKKADDFAAEVEATERFPESVLSGLTVEEVRQGGARLAAVREALARSGATAGDADAAHQSVMLASQGQRPFSGPGWLFEIKYDGVRILAARDGDAVTLYGRAGQDFTSRYPEVVDRAPRPAGDALRHRRRGDRARRERPPVVPAPAESHAPDRAGRRGSRARGGAGERGILRRARARGTRPAQAPAGRAQGAAGADGARSRRHPLWRPRRRAGRGVLRGGGRAAAGGHRRQARGGPLHRRAHARVAQDQMPPAAGVRDRRLDRSAGGAGLVRRPASRCVRGRPPGLRRQGRHRVRRGDAAPGVGSAAAARAAEVTIRQRHADGPRSSLGRADPGRRGPLHGVDGGGRHSPPRLPGAARRQTRERVPA